ncbi:MAG: hypothetical protein IJX72_00050, partial [Clostridia bacterium]|nr:hypothetical protein [Clostridia bacterium]
MRGDLVYEKLGEIDPALIEEALPNNVPPVLVSSLFEKPKRTYYFNARKFAVICACLTLVAVILIGGGVILSRMVDLPWETDTTETQPSPNFNPASLAYEGTVAIEGFGELEGLDSLTSLSGEIREAFNSAELAEDVCECERYLSMQIGEDALTYNPEHGCFRDGETGDVYVLSSEGKAFVNQALKELETREPVLVSKHAIRHYGDAFEFSLQVPYDP